VKKYLSNMNHEEVWGRQQVMVLSALRYCLTRRNYIVSDCAQWIIKYWWTFEISTRLKILNELKDVVDDDELMDPISKDIWIDLIAFIERRPSNMMSEPESPHEII